MFEYLNLKKVKDDRSLFVNDILRLLVEKNNGDFTATIKSKEFKKFYEHINNNIADVYELADSEIPLLGLYELEKFGADNYDMNKEKFAEAIERTKKACELYYGTVTESSQVQG